MARLGADDLHAAYVDPDRRQGPDGPRAAAQPLVARPAVRHPRAVSPRRRSRTATASSRSTSTSSTTGWRSATATAPVVRRWRSSRSRSPGSTASSWPGCEASGSRSGSGPMPVEVADAIPFDVDEQHASYDPGQAESFWRGLLQADRVLKAFQTGFVGKASPVHFFWGSFDLATTRYSGRPAPRHPGGAPNCPNWVMEEAYSREEISVGWWPLERGARSAVLLLHVPRARGASGRAPVAPGGGVLRRQPRRVRPALRRGAHARTIRTPPYWRSSSRPMTPAPTSATGTGRCSNRRSAPTGRRDGRGAWADNPRCQPGGTADMTGEVRRTWDGPPGCPRRRARSHPAG